MNKNRVNIIDTEKHTDCLVLLVIYRNGLQIYFVDVFVPRIAGKGVI
jgi:hypothetical protein